MSESQEERDDEAPTEEGFARSLWPLVGYVVIGSLLGVWLWHLGHTAHSTWARGLLQGGAGACLGLAAWCALWLVFLGAMAVIARRSRLDTG